MLQEREREKRTWRKQKERERVGNVKEEMVIARICSWLAGCTQEREREREKACFCARRSEEKEMKFLNKIEDERNLEKWICWRDLQIVEGGKIGPDEI